MRTEYRVQWEHWLPWAGWRASTLDTFDYDEAKAMYDQLMLREGAEPAGLRNVQFLQRTDGWAQASNV